MGDVNAGLALRGRVLGRVLAPEGTTFTGIVMDWNVGGPAVGTLVAMDDGAVSMYFSGGGGVIGAGERSEIRAKADDVRREVSALMGRMRPVAEFPLPRSGNVFFYVVSESATSRSDEFQADELNRPDHPFARAWASSQALISEMRRVSPPPAAAAAGPAKKPSWLGRMLGRTMGGLTPSQHLYNAVVHGDVDAVRQSLEAGADARFLGPDKLPVLFPAVTGDRAEVIRILIEAGADPNTVVAGSDKRLNGVTMLSLASRMGKLEAMRALMTAGADVNAREASGHTPLMGAAFENKPAAIALLLERGADLRATAVAGTTALMFACQAGNVDVVRVLLDHGANANDADDAGGTPLMFAAQHGHVELVRLLIERGADPHRTTAAGYTAHFLAKHNRHASTAELLEAAMSRPPAR